MSIRRCHIEMQPLDFETGWQALAGFPEGLEVKLLSDDLDEANKTGGRTRLVRFAPGTATTTALIHDYWEEAFVISGQLGFAESGKSTADRMPAYSCRPPGTPHGPFVSRDGCVLLEVQYYAATKGLPS
jgi:hypothetical protein